VLLAAGLAWFIFRERRRDDASGTTAWILAVATLAAVAAAILFLWNATAPVAAECGGAAADAPHPVTGLTPREEYERTVRVTSYVGAFFAISAAALLLCAMYLLTTTPAASAAAPAAAAPAGSDAASVFAESASTTSSGSAAAPPAFYFPAATSLPRRASPAAGSAAPPSRMSPSPAATSPMVSRMLAAVGDADAA
jgi:hypothetical protein